MFGAALAAAVWIARSTMHKSPEFVRQAEAGDGSRGAAAPRSAASSRRNRPRFRDLGAGVDHLLCGLTYVPAFLTSAGTLSEEAALWLSTTAAVVVIAVTPFVGLWSDRIGRRPVLLALALGSAALPISMFTLMASGSHPAGSARRMRIGRAGRGRQCRRRRRHRGTIPGRRKGHRLGARRDHGDGGVWRADPVEGAQYTR